MRKPRITTTIKDRDPLHVLHFGSGRGTRLGLAAYEEFNAASPWGVVPTFIDAQPGAALAVATEAKARGIAAQSLEARVEDVVESLATSEQTACVVVALDHGAPIADIIEHAPASVYVLGTLLIKIPLGPLYGLSFCLGPDEIEERAPVADLFRRIGELTVPRGSRAIVGEEGDVADRAGEPFLRAGLASRSAGILRKAIARLRPEVSPLELTVDQGRSSLPVFVVADRPTWSGPAELAAQTVERTRRPLLRGESFAIAELLVGQPALRLHIVRLRMDGRIAIEGSSSLDAETLARAAQEEDVQLRAGLALARSQQRTLSQTAPVFTTD